MFNVKNILTAEEAANYTIKNVMGGTDNWQPDLMCEACDAPRVIINGSKIEWPAVPYAICYVVIKDGAAVGFTTDTSYDYAGGSTYHVQAVNEFGGLSAKGKATIASGISEIPAEDISSQSLQPQPVYNLNGQRLNALHKGLNILNGKAVLVK